DSLLHAVVIDVLSIEGERNVQDDQASRHNALLCRHAKIRSDPAQFWVAIFDEVQGNIIRQRCGCWCSEHSLDERVIQVRGAERELGLPQSLQPVMVPGCLLEHCEGQWMPGQLPV